MLDAVFLVPVVVGLLVIGLAAFVLAHIKTVAPSEALIISGARSNGDVKVAGPGSRVFIVPVLQSAETISLAQQKINFILEDALDASKIPLNINGNAIVKVGSDGSMIRAAAERFPDGGNNSIGARIQDIFTGAVRSVASTMPAEELISKREELKALVQERIAKEIGGMGLLLEAFEITEISDKHNYISNLAVPRAEEALRVARIAKAENARMANDSEVEQGRAIAEKNKELAVYKAALKAETDKAEADAAAAGPLAQAKAARQIAEEERLTAAARAEVREKELESEIKKPADAERYRREQEAAAEAATIRLRSAAEAEATEVRGRATAEAVKAAGLAEAEVVKAAGLAEAEAMDAKAAAYENYGQAAITDNALKVLPQVAGSIAEAYASVDNVSIISTDGTSELAKAIGSGIKQAEAVVKATTGVDLSEMVSGVVSSATVSRK